MTIDTVEVAVVQRRGGEKQLAAQGWGWPEHEETAKGLESFTSAMEWIGKRVDVDDHEVGEPDALVTSIEIDQ